MPPLEKPLIAGLLATVALAILVAAAIVAIPTPSGAKRAKFKQWEAAQNVHSVANKTKEGRQ